MATLASTVSTLSFLLLLAGTPIVSCQQPESSTKPDTGVLPTFTPVSGGASKEGPSGLLIVDDDEVYKYAGCYAETTEQPPHNRALDGVYLTVAGKMQVQPCIQYCARSYNRFHPEKKGWKYAGLEYSRECWCGDSLSLNSVKLEETSCDAPCDGNNSTVCGGHLALTLYNATTTPGGGKPGKIPDGDDDSTTYPQRPWPEKPWPPKKGGSPKMSGAPSKSGGPKMSHGSKPEGEAVAQAVGIGLVVVAVTFVLGMGCL
ncbi:WSC domain-containing protein [Rostrohypoxylon terebratum]|nr:WSC domain-containing protein [Rostrohypoxylon terebratum]